MASRQQMQSPRLGKAKHTDLSLLSPLSPRRVKKNTQPWPQALQDTTNDVTSYRQWRVS